MWLNFVPTKVQLRLIAKMTQGMHTILWARTSTTIYFYNFVVYLGNQMIIFVTIIIYYVKNIRMCINIIILQLMCGFPSESIDPQLTLKCLWIKNKANKHQLKKNSMTLNINKGTYNYNKTLIIIMSHIFNTS